jgi:hypothetical protein
VATQSNWIFLHLVVQKRHLVNYGLRQGERIIIFTVTFSGILSSNELKSTQREKKTLHQDNAGYRCGFTRFPRNNGRFSPEKRALYRVYGAMLQKKQGSQP